MAKTKKLKNNRIQMWLIYKQAYTDYSDSVARRMGFIPLPLAVLVRNYFHLFSYSSYMSFSQRILSETIFVYYVFLCLLGYHVVSLPTCLFQTVKWRIKQQMNTHCICDTDLEDMVLFSSPSVDSSGDELSEDPGRSLICLSAPLLSWVKSVT